MANEESASKKRRKALSAPYRVLGFDVGARNLAVALIEWDGNISDTPPHDWRRLHIVRWERIDCLREAGCSVVDSTKVPTVRVCDMVMQAVLERMRSWHLASEGGSPDCIVIEEQPLKRSRRGTVSVGSVRNKLFAQTIYTTLKMFYGVHCQIACPKIVMQSSRCKLLVGADPSNALSEPPKLRRAPKTKTTYEARKESSVVLARRILGFIDPYLNEDAITTFQTSWEKDDDLADVLNHSIYALQATLSKRARVKSALARP